MDINPDDPDNIEPPVEPPTATEGATTGESMSIVQSVPVENAMPESIESAATVDAVEPKTSVEEPATLSFESLIELPQLNAAELAYRIGWQWADFQLYVVSPAFAAINPPVLIPPEPLIDGSGLEFVYPIKDYGFKLATSKAEEMFSAGMSMCKLYYTIEKMIYILVERLNSGGISTETEVQVAFAGFILAQRKGFESIINLSYNVVVTNFEPGEWGEQYLQTIKRLANKGYGYPPEAPRDYFKHTATSSTQRKP